MMTHHCSLKSLNSQLAGDREAAKDAFASEVSEGRLSTSMPPSQCGQPCLASVAVFQDSIALSPPCHMEIHDVMVCSSDLAPFT